jgi:hypothetical protein
MGVVGLISDDVHEVKTSATRRVCCARCHYYFVMTALCLENEFLELQASIPGYFTINIMGQRAARQIIFPSKRCPPTGIVG